MHTIKRYEYKNKIKMTEMTVGQIGKIIDSDHPETLCIGLYVLCNESHSHWVCLNNGANFKYLIASHFNVEIFPPGTKLEVTVGEK